MAILFQNKPENKRVDLSVGTAYLKPLPMSLLPFASKLGGEDVKPKDQEIAFAMILKEVMVDEHDMPFDDLQDMTAEDIGRAFTLDDFTKVIGVLMPAPEDESGNMI